MSPWRDRPLGDMPLSVNKQVYIPPRLAALEHILPSLIFIYKGAIADIPTGFHLCDGSVVNGITTEDLTDKFILCADADSGGTYDVDDTGGAATHTHTGPSHTHTGPSHTHTGTGTTNAGNDPVHRDTAGSGNNAQSLGHTHSFGLTVNAAGTNNTGAGGTGATGAAGTGETSTTNHLPPFAAKAYVQYVGV